MDACIMVMAGGTGGHVYPALAVAEELRNRGARVFWLGTPNSFEQRVVGQNGFDLELVDIKGLRGNGLFRLLLAPFKLIHSMSQALRILRRRRPSLVLGMGGFVSGPGGVASRLLGIPLVIHEQNAIPGMTNRLLSHLAQSVLEAFPGSFSAATGARMTGNPVRQSIDCMALPGDDLVNRQRRLRLLILGGSLGAQALNEAVPAALASVDPALRPQVWHQSGHNKADAARAGYASSAVEARVDEFIDDMAQAYTWADLVICRAGALTITELAAVGRGAILVPYPHAVDDHQTANAGYLVEAGAAELLPQSDLTPASLAQRIDLLVRTPERVLEMARRARKLATPDATRRVADICEEMIR